MSQGKDDVFRAKLIELGESIGVGSTFWEQVAEIENCFDIILTSDYFYDVHTEEVILISADTKSEEVTNTVRSGSKFACLWVEPFSSDWYICQALDFLRRCLADDTETRLRASFQLGKAIAEANWKRRTGSKLRVASSEASRMAKAGVAGGRQSSERRRQNITCLMEEIEALGDLAGRLSEQVIFEQAYTNASARRAMPKSEKTKESYGILIRSEEPFKSRYEAVFRRTA